MEETATYNAGNLPSVQELARELFDAYGDVEDMAIDLTDAEHYFKKAEVNHFNAGIEVWKQASWDPKAIGANEEVRKMKVADATADTGKVLDSAELTRITARSEFDRAKLRLQHLRDLMTLMLYVKG